MYYAIMVAFVMAAWKWGDWKNWRQYYSTVLYFIVGDLAYNLLAYNKPLWEYSSGGIPHTVLDMFFAGTVFPSMVLLFLPYFPKSNRFHQSFYVILWVGIGAVMDALLKLFGNFIYSNGWDFWWSILFYVLMFPLLKIHYEKPLVVWPISVALAGLVLYIFKIPFSLIR